MRSLPWTHSVWFWNFHILNVFILNSVTHSSDSLVFRSHCLCKGTWRQTWCHTCWKQLGVISAVCGGETRVQLWQCHLNDTVSLTYRSLLRVWTSCLAAPVRIERGVLVWMVRSCVSVTVCTHRAQCSDYNGPIKLPHLLVCPSPSPLLPPALSPSYPVFIRLCDFLIPLFSSRVWKLTLLRVIMESPGLLIIWRDHHRDPRPCSPKPLML